MYQRRTSDSDICAENVPAGSIRKLTRSDPNQVRIPTLQDLRGFRKTSQAQEASRVEPRFLRPMHYDSSAWDFNTHRRKTSGFTVTQGKQYF